MPLMIGLVLVLTVLGISVIAEPYLDLLEALEGAEKCAAELGIAPIRDAMERGDWRAAAWYLERRLPSHWRPGANGGAHDEKEDAAGHVEYDPVADEKLLAKFQRIAEVNEARAADALQQVERELDALRPGDYSQDDWDKLKENALRPLRALFQQDGQSLIARAVGPRSLAPRRRLVMGRRTRDGRPRPPRLSLRLRPRKGKEGATPPRCKS